MRLHSIAHVSGPCHPSTHDCFREMLTDPASHSAQIQDRSSPALALGLIQFISAHGGGTGQPFLLPPPWYASRTPLGRLRARPMPSPSLESHALPTTHNCLDHLYYACCSPDVQRDTIEHVDGRDRHRIRIKAPPRPQLNSAPSLRAIFLFWLSLRRLSGTSDPL